MIRNKREYSETRRRIDDFARQRDAMAQKLRRQGYEQPQIAIATAGLDNLLDELTWECDFYDSLRTQGLCAIPDYPPEDRGKALIAIRISEGLSQKELADALGVSQAQVSRDERNEYRGITSDRYARVLGAMGVEEHVAGYQHRVPLTIMMPTIQREAASFTPDYEHRFEIKAKGPAQEA